MRPTTIRSAMIGNKLGTVISVIGHGHFEVWFQLYQVNDVKGGPFMMVREDRFDTESDAKSFFDAWVYENHLLGEVA